MTVGVKPGLALTHLFHSLFVGLIISAQRCDDADQENRRKKKVLEGRNSRRRSTKKKKNGTHLREQIRPGLPCFVNYTKAIYLNDVIDQILIMCLTFLGVTVT